MPIEIRQFPCLSDNYGYLVHDRASGATATVDTPDAAAINAALESEGWRLNFIFNTHHHWDHTGSNLELKEKWGCEIIGPAGERERIPGIDRALADGDTVMLGESRARIYDTPGHTLGHIVYHFEDHQAAFVGDTIFALGCGRLFEGDAQQMWSSLSKIAAWPTETKLYCAHEYTQGNARFALTIEPNNEALAARARDIDEARAEGRPTVPTTVGEELATSPFLRADAAALQAALSMDGADPVDVFAEVRKRKDVF